MIYPSSNLKGGFVKFQISSAEGKKKIILPIKAPQATRPCYSHLLATGSQFCGLELSGGCLEGQGGLAISHVEP